MTEDCGKCAAHSGIEKSIEVLEKTNIDMKQTMNKIHTKTIATLVSVTITSLLLLANFVIKHYDTAVAAAQELPK